MLLTVCGDHPQWNEIAQFWRRPDPHSENDAEEGDEEAPAPEELPTEYSIRRICWTFQTLKEPQEVEFTLSIYNSALLPFPPEEGEDDIIDYQPVRPALFSTNFTATVETEPVVISVDIDFRLFQFISSPTKSFFSLSYLFIYLFYIFNSNN